MKFVVVVLVVVVLLWLLGWQRRRRRAEEAAPSPPPAPATGAAAAPVPMLRCVHCGTHVAAPEAVRSGDLVFCSDEHRAEHPRRDG